MTTLYTFKMLCTGYTTKKNIDVSFAEHLIIPKKIFPDFYTCILGRQQQTKIKTLRTLYIVKMLYVGVPRKNQYHCFFHGVPKNSRKIDFYTHNLGDY